MRRAPFLSLDGIDGTGKSTQCRLLVGWLNASGVPALACADPGGTPLGDRLRSILLEWNAAHEEISPRAEAMLFMASRAELVARIIAPALEAGTVVVSDRFLLSTVVYQGHAGGLDPAALWQTGTFATDGLLPDLTLVLDLPVADAVQRRGRAADRVESRPTEYQERVRQGFLDEARTRPDRVRVIDATPPVEVLQQRLRAELIPTLAEWGFAPAGPRTP